MARTSSYLPGVHGPTNCVRVPQAPIHPASQRPSIYSAVQFFLETYPSPGIAMPFPEPGLRISNMMRKLSQVFGGDDQVMHAFPENSINVYINWSGYRATQKRISTLSGTITRLDLVLSLCKVILEWARDPEPIGGSTDGRWSVGDGQAINPHNIFVTELVHRGGSSWQVEMWVTQDRF
ncbi:hypothetical protein H1R20_g16453, partial [Candolleomyces eurysporus]